jgi:hypothetical protein
MFRSVLRTALSAVAFAALASAANAAVVVTLQFQEAGFPTEFIGSGAPIALFSGAFGTASNVNAYGYSPAACSPESCPGFGLDPNEPLGALFSGTLSGGTLTFLATITGVTAPLGTSVPFAISSFVGGSPTPVQLSTFVDPADVPFSMAHFLGSTTLTGTLRSPIPTPFGPLTAPYSLTEEFIITATGNEATQANIVIFAVVPEPSTWAMMLIGFAALGFAFHRSRRKMSFA